MEHRQTRRKILGMAAGAAITVTTAGLAEALPVPTPILDDAVVARNDASVAHSLEAQVTDAASPYRGSTPDEYLVHAPGSASSLIEVMTSSYVCPQSRYHKSAELLKRIQLAAGFLERVQSTEGFVDLLSTNFDSPPDTAFVVHNVGTAAAIGKLYGADEIVSALRAFLVKAGDGLAVGGIHTPNHRWVVSSALAQINDVYPNAAYVRRIEQWLAEGIDIDADDQYIERSTVTYNTIIDRALVVLAAKLKRPALLEPVRRNLSAMVYLIHPDGEVVTEVSRRQDQFTKGTMNGYWFPASYVASHMGDATAAALVKSMSPEAARMGALLEYPELTKALPAAGVLPVSYEKTFPLLSLARIRRGQRDATLVLAENTRFFTTRNGGAVVNAVRFASSFFGKGQFAAEAWAMEGKSYVLKQSLEAPYYQPLSPAQTVTSANWAALRDQRRKTQLQKLEQSVVVTERDYGFDVRVRSSGTNGVPLAIEVSLREGGTLEGCKPAPNAPDCWLLERDYATYKLGGGVMRIGPGAAPHLQTQLRGADAKLPGQSLYITGYTPFDRVVEFRFA